jgi:PAS domain S-box-containing protein
MRNKLLVLSLCGVLPAIVVSLVAYDAITTLNRKTQVLVASSTFLSNHWEGDMLHDDLRGDLYAVLAGSSEGERESARAEMASDARRFRAALARGTKVEPLDGDLNAALNDLRPEREAYIAECETLADLVERDRRRAIRALPHFEKAFQLLDQRQAAVNRMILSYQAAAERDSSRTADLSKRILLIVVTLTFFGIVAAAWFLTRSVRGPVTVGMQTILAQSNIIGVFRGNQRGQFVEANDAFLNMFGYSRQDLEAGKMRWDHMTPPEYEEVSKSLAFQVQSYGTAPPTEVEFIRKDGTRLPVLMGLASLDRGARRAVGFVLDLTKRRAAEDAARASERRLQAIVDSLDDLVLELDSQGTYVNIWTRNESALIRPKDELIGRTCQEFLDHDLMTSVLEGIRRVLATGLSEEMEYSMVIGGAKRWFLARFNPLGSQPGASKTVCLVIRDITQRKAAEAQMLRAMQAAELANRTKSEFLANMSHEIRTPMHGILGTLELVLESELKDEQRRYLDLAKTSADSLLGILNDILDLSKIEAGKFELDPVEFAPAATVRRVTQTLALSAGQKGLKLTSDVAPGVPEELKGDEGRLRQVLINLVGNAIKFTEHGEVGIRMTADNISDDAILLHFVVWDTGIGIPAEKQKVIFEAFSQADTSTSRRFGGTGLGLTISSRLVEAMGGRIWVNSTPGQGSEFHCTVVFRSGDRNKVSKSAGQAHPTLAIQSAPITNGSAVPVRVLLAEDNPINVRVAVGLLEKRGYKVTVAGNGREAIQALDRDIFDVVLMDMHMPELDGLEATRAIRQKEKTTGLHVPIIALTAAAMKSDEEECLAAGMDAYIAKPFQASVLFNTLEATMKRFANTGGRSSASTPLSSASARHQSRPYPVESKLVSGL